MSINDPYEAPHFRQPRIRVLNQGRQIGGAIGLELENNNYYRADTFSAEFALYADPAFGMNFWASQPSPMLLDLQASLDAGQTWKSLLIGQVDHVEMGPEQGVCHVSGRDLSSYLIDTKTQKAYLNKTASQIATEIAAEHGLTPDVTPTKTLVQRYYDTDHDQLSNGDFTRVTTEWNLLASFAQHEQFDLWVSGTTLHFHPKSDRDNSEPWTVVWQTVPMFSNTTGLRLQRSMWMAKDIFVAVRSWHSKNGRGFTKYSPKRPTQSALSSGKGQLFTFTVPNLTEAQGQDLANAKQQELTRHERIISFSCPGDLVLTPRSKILLTGTGSDADTQYYCDSVTRRIGWDGGFQMDVRGKNHPGESTVT